MSTPTRILRCYHPGPVVRRTVERCQWQTIQPHARPSPPQNSSSLLPPSPVPAKSITTLQHADLMRGGAAPLPQVWFSANFPRASRRNNELGTDPDKPPDDRKVKLGKTLRILQEHLPTLLQTPLPQEVLSPNISLHLFPSTHPHLPTVTGRVAYIAALWSSPIAWNRVPIVGNVKLEILSERMVKQPAVYSAPRRQGAYGEQLIVRWRTIGKGRNWGLPFMYNGSSSSSSSNDKKEVAVGQQQKGTEIATRMATEKTEPQKAPVGMAQAVGSSKEFTGLFIFDFDREGRILSHTIEHVQESGQWEKGVGAKVVGLTDWLLGGMKGGENAPPCPAFARKGG
ncbi:hypothetical protein B0H66DRAFT_332191 [Apodospora peruviana]|uniref:Chromosome transmission fidelity protein 4 n=1 Tax=Apodospora peruviana TaxID=516989 RepID=A0AAE0HYC6_9PEZI|nr:hypothetical protein B0H66DRAFT_332191 [Apodospora peruviana]